MRTSYHWYGVLAFLASGFAFVSVYYVTFPLLVVTSTVILTSAKVPRRWLPAPSGPGAGIPMPAVARRNERTMA
jgi:hypothetical protein